MTNLIPGFVYQPLPIDYSKRPRRQKGRGLVGHVAVSESSNLRPWDENDWHAYLPREGPGIQYIDLDYVAYTSYDGSYSLASFESQGGTGSSAELNVEPWSDNQLRLAATFLRHLHDTEGVPLQVMPDSRPSSRGFATHRLGVDPWRVAGGEHWTRHYGKECPGTRKHEQRFDIVRLAASADLEDDMPSAKEVVDEFLNTVVTLPDKSKASIRSLLPAIRQSEKSIQGDTDDLQNVLARVEARLTAIEAKLPAEPAPPAA